jgi:hypothetical protein
MRDPPHRQSHVRNVYLLFVANVCLVRASSVANVRYVVIQAPPYGDEAYLRITEVVVMAGGVNVALNKSCVSSSQYLDHSCSFALDGDLEAESENNTYISNTPSGDWIHIDLETEYDVTSVVFYNRGVFSFAFPAPSPSAHILGFITELLPGIHDWWFSPID